MQKPSYLNIVIVVIILILCSNNTVISQTFRQTQKDSYTRYELLDPESNSFRIYYDVSATTAGANYYFNSIRQGSEAIVHGVSDLMSGVNLKWDVVDGATAKSSGHETANPERHYIRIKLPRPVPEGGEVRLRIDKTYKDKKSYYIDNNNSIVFSRSLGIKRNSVVLPSGYELITCNYPSQVRTESDGRIRISFMNRGPASVPFTVSARLLPRRINKVSEVQHETRQESATNISQTRSVASSARLDYTFSERAFQDREIVYFLKQPESHSFFLYHDYTESRQGVDKYLNIVRKGSKASEPSAFILDTGQELKVEKYTGKQIKEQGIEIEREVDPETEVVIIWFDPVKKGQSVRLRISETYTDPNRYLLLGDELIWDRSFGRPRNSVILPEGWYVTTNSIPAIISETDDGKIRLYYVNDRPGNIDVLIKAKRR